jgi:hypothetical protein
METCHNFNNHSVTNINENTDERTGMFLFDGCIIFSFTNIYIFFSSQKEDEIEEYLRKKYADESVPMRHFGDGGEEMSDEITQQTLLPGVK